MTRRVVFLDHGAVRLALHSLSGDSGSHEVGPTLLVLHELGGAACDLELPDWPGSVWGLDFTGHGESSVPRGGGMSPEVLLGDVDAALRHIGPATVLGFGLGAYVGLLASGASPREVRGTVVAQGRGLAGGGPEPTPLQRGAAVFQAGLTGSELLIAELESDVRPPGYAALSVRQARFLSSVDNPIAVDCEGGGELPPWLEAVLACEGAVAEPAVVALARFATAGA